LVLAIPVQHYVEAIGENGEHRRLGYVVEKIGESERILPHAVAQKFEVSSSGALIAATENSTKPVSLIITAQVSRVEPFDLRMT
jgi:hypothetical protein